MPELTIQGITLSPAARQQPRIIVPIMAESAEEALKQAKKLIRRRWEGVVDLVELRLDPLIAKGENWTGALCAVHKLLSDPPEETQGQRRPLLATIRTKREGGEADLTPDAYAEAVQKLLNRCRPELVDLEFSAGPDIVATLRDAARAAGVRTVFSEHHFDATPSETVMTETLCRMADAGADIVKLAVMANTRTDANTLLAATARAAELRPDTPRITMSMGPRGTITRVCGGLFGSCATFGSVDKTSAPGQLDARTLRRALKALPNTIPEGENLE